MGRLLPLPDGSLDRPALKPRRSFFSMTDTLRTLIQAAIRALLLYQHDRLADQIEAELRRMEEQ